MDSRLKESLIKRKELQQVKHFMCQKRVGSPLAWAHNIYGHISRCDVFVTIEPLAIISPCFSLKLILSFNALYASGVMSETSEFDGLFQLLSQNNMLSQK